MNKKLILKFVLSKFFFWKKFKKFKKEKVKKILIVSEYLGDVIVTSSFLKNLRYNFPDAEIILQCRKQAKDAAECIPYINRITTINFPFGSKFGDNDGYLIIPKYIIKNIKKYDLIVSLGGLMYNPILIFCGKYLIGFEEESLILTELLDKNPHPTFEEIKEALSGNLCRCSGYLPILESVKEASE